jgi:squalene-associated FAD-dependent desaturase
MILSSPDSLNPAIIGGGYAGMAAAMVLAGRGIPVTVYESAKQLGGRARGIPYKSLQLDNGQHILLGCYRQTLRLIELAGGDIGQDFLRLPLQLTLHGRFELKLASRPARPSGSLVLLAGLMRARGLSLSRRISAARFMLALRRLDFTLPHDMTVLELMRAHHQDEVLVRLLWEPICIAALNTPVQRASARVLLNVLRDSLNGGDGDSDILLPRLDLSTLFPQRAGQYVRQRGGTIYISCSVQAIIPHGGGVELLTTAGVQHHSHVICAASPANAARLLRAVPQLVPAANQVEAIRFQPIYTVYLQYPQQVSLPQPMLGLDRCFAQWLFDKGRIAGQHGLIAAVISAEGPHQDWEHEQIAQKVAAELREQLGLVETPLWSRVIAEKRATFSCEPDLARPAHTTPLASVLLAGDYTAGDYPATLEGAVISGLRSADALQPR